MTLEEFIDYLNVGGWKRNYDGYSFTKDGMTISYDETDRTVSILCSEMTAPVENVSISDNGRLLMSNPVAIVKKNTAEERIRILKETLNNIFNECRKKEKVDPFSNGYFYGVRKAIQEFDKIENDKTALMSGDGTFFVSKKGEKK